ncbi:hypothetical protein [Bacillus subtilis]|uniref:hypothetical protein n=3 Tax=Bacillus subtilis TaxID=1423 RepID=UPI000F8E7355|nr:hypothetical protein [Bacillus subtilis]
MKQDELFLTVNWCKEDIFEIFEKKGIPLSQTNFLKLKELGGAKTLLERTVEDGWEVLDIIVDLYKDEFIYDFVIIEHKSIPYVLSYDVLNDYCEKELGCDIGEFFFRGNTWDNRERLIDHLNLEDGMCRASLSDTHFEYVTWIYHNGDTEDLLMKKAKYLFEWLGIEVNGHIELEDY